MNVLVKLNLVDYEEKTLQCYTKVDVASRGGAILPDNSADVVESLLRVRFLMLLDNGHGL